MAENSLILNKREAEAVLTFLRGIDGVHVLRADDLLEGLRGFVAFRDSMLPSEGDEREEVLLFQWRDAKPVRREDRVPVLPNVMEPDPDNDTTVGDMFADEVRRLINIPGWKVYDDPKRRLIGFIRQVPPDSHEESKALLIPLTAFKAMPDDLKEQVMKWRNEHEEG